MRYKLGQLDATGHEHVTFGDTNLSSVFEVLSVTMDAIPSIEPATVRVPGRAGSHYYGREIGDRVLTIRLSLHAHSRDPLDVFREWRQVSPALWRQETQRLYLDEGMYLNAMVTGEFPLEFLGPRGVVDVQFTCYDPYFHGRDMEVPLEAGDNEFMVVSQCETWPTIEVTGASGSVSVTDKGTGQKVVVPGTDHATIHMETMRATVDGAFKPVDMTQTDFFPLSPEEITTVSLASGEGVLRYQELAL